MIGMIKGMGITLRHMLSPAFTEAYPFGRRELPERTRMSFAMGREDGGGAHCKACLLCEKSCPDGAIRLVTDKRPDAPGRMLVRFEIDLGLCMHCGICVENCAAGGLHFTDDFEHLSTTREGMVLVLYDELVDGAAQLDQAVPPAIVEPSPAGLEGGPA